MFTWSVRRRVLYLLITVLILAAVGAGLYWYYKPLPSCRDGKQNQDEVGIDCGGVCAQVCPTEIKPPKVLWTRILKVDDDKYDAVTYIENPNLHHGIRKMDYAIRVIDQNNILITNLSGTTFLNPKEKFVVFNSRLDTGRRVPARAIFEFSEPPLWQKIDREIPKLTVINRGFANTPKPQLAASVINESLEILENFEVVAMLTGADGNALAVSSTFVETLGKGESRDIMFTWPKPLAEEPATIDFYPHIDISKLNG